MATATETDKMAALATAANEARGLAMDSIAAAHSGHMVFLLEPPRSEPPFMDLRYVIIFLLEILNLVKNYLCLA